MQDDRLIDKILDEVGIIEIADTDAYKGAACFSLPIATSTISARPSNSTSKADQLTKASKQTNSTGQLANKPVSQTPATSHHRRPLVEDGEQWSDRNIGDEFWTKPMSATFDQAFPDLRERLKEVARSTASRGSQGPRTMGNTIEVPTALTSSSSIGSLSNTPKVNGHQRIMLANTDQEPPSAGQDPRFVTESQRSHEIGTGFIGEFIVSSNPIGRSMMLHIDTYRWLGCF